MRRATPLLLLLPLALACWPTLSSGFRQMQTDPADTRHLNYVLEHDYRWLCGHAELWNPPFFWPEPNVAAYTELMLGVLPLYAPWRAVGFEPDTAFQLWVLTVLVLNALAAHLLFRRGLGFAPLPALAGAWLTAFGSGRMAQINHQHLLPCFFTLLAVYALVRLFRGGGRGYVALFFAMLTLQLWAGLQVGWLFCFWLGVVLLWSLAFAETRPKVLQLLRTHAVALSVGAVTSGLLLLPLVLPYRAAAAAAGARSFDEAVVYLPQLQSWLYQGPHSVLYAWLADLSVFSRLPAEGEHRIGVGLVTTGVMVLMLREKGWPRVLGATVLTVLVLATLYRGRVSPWQGVMAVVPGANGIRAVARIGLSMAFPAAIAVACFAARTRRLGWLVVLFCVAEQLQQLPNAYSKEQVRADVAHVAHGVRGGCRAFFYAPRDQEKYDEKTQLDAMWASLWVGVPTVNGYSSHFPRGWQLMDHGVDDDGDVLRLTEALGQWAQSRQVSPADICWVSP
ncbi:MAG: hypothetical protein IPJ65_00120 [Archangiaceae bacterium]|nr:hypothetical protein [Archangiaceae bacterium]